MKITENDIQRLASFPIQNPNPVLEVDVTNGQVTFKNPAAEKQFPELTEVGHDHAFFLGVMNHVKEKKDFSREVSIADRYFEQKMFFIPQTDLVRVFLHDLTERKKTEKNLARLATFPEQNPNPIIEFDLEGRITYTNWACQRLFPDLLNLTFKHQLLMAFEEVFKKIVSGELTESVEEINLGDQYYIQRAKFMPEMSLVRVFHTDITSQKEAEQIIREKNKDITDSINYARRIQRSILPTGEELKKMLGDYFVLYIPKDIVSGDFYWSNVVTAQDNEKQKYNLVAAVDCTGHGVPGALMSIVGSTLLNQTIRNPDINSPAEALDFLNRELPKNLRAQNPGEEIRDGMDMTMVAIVKEKMIMHFAGANNPVYIVRNNELIELKGDKQPISGSTSDVKKNFTNHKFQLQNHDLIYLLTDGFADQFGGPKGKKFMYKPLKEKLVEFSKAPMNEQKEKLEKTFNDWRGDQNQVDDVLIIGIKV